MSIVAKSAAPSFLLAVLTMVAVACGQPATQSESQPIEGAAEPPDTSAPEATDGSGGEATEPSTEGAAASSCDPSAYESVQDEIDGLDQQQRWDRLIELAEQEQGTFQVYATISGDEIGPLMDDFLATIASSEIEATHYRAGSNDLLQRITEEERAGRAQADAVISTGIDQYILSSEGLLQPFDTPYADDILESTVHPDWAGVYLNVYTSAWNTDLLAEADAPATWEEVLSYDAGPVGFEVKSYDWFGTLVTEYFMAEQGLSEEEAVQLFTEASDNMVPVDGRSALTELLAAGEFAVAAATYTQNVDSASVDGAPVTWEPPVEPLIQRPNGVAPMCGSDMPATALLFVDYLLSEAGQNMMVSFDRIPTSTTIEGALNPDYETVSVDVAEMANNREKWIELYGQVTGEPVG